MQTVLRCWERLTLCLGILILRINLQRALHLAESDAPYPMSKPPWPCGFVGSECILTEPRTPGQSPRVSNKLNKKRDL